MNKNETSNADCLQRLVRPCRLCKTTPTLPKLWTDESGNHSESATIACGCGVQAVVKLENKYAAKKGDTGWSMIAGDWNMSLSSALEIWNNLMA